jgi:hypothetical protein
VLAKLQPISPPCDGNNPGWYPVPQPPPIVPEPYALTANDRRAFDQIEQEDALALAQSPDCKGTKRSGNIQWPGVMQHWLIMIDYLSRNPLNGEVEYQVPGGSASGNRGYADIVNLLSGEMFEIKPDNQTNISLEQTEVYRYVTQGNINCPRPPGSPFKVGEYYETRYIPNPTSPGYAFEVKLSATGVITYSEALVIKFLKRFLFHNQFSTA